MTDERTGAGESGATLALLWRREMAEKENAPSPPRKGPKRALTVERIVETAISVADNEGLNAVTMRRIAQALGVVPMTLYTYVPGKPELLDLMLDSLYVQMVPSQTSDASWRSRLEGIAHDNLSLYRRHPWAALISTARPPLGPGLFAKYERELSALDGLGLTDVEMDDALTFLLSFVRACAREEASILRASQQNPLTDAQWWESNAPLLAQLVNERDFPLGTRVGTATGESRGAAYSPEHAYTFGLARVLDGLATLIEGSRRQDGQTPIANAR